MIAGFGDSGIRRVEVDVVKIDGLAEVVER